MAYTPASGKASYKYNQKAYDKLSFVVKKGNAPLIKAHAAELGMSFNGYMKYLIEQDMAKHGKDVSL